MENDEIPETDCILFVAGNEPNSVLARNNLKQLLDHAFPPATTSRIINVFEDTQAAIDHEILVTPCLVVYTDQEPIFIVGNLSDHAKIRRILRLGSGSDD